MKAKKVDNEALQIFKDVNGIQKGHFVLTKDGHSGEYVAKDRVSPHVQRASSISRLTAKDLVAHDIKPKAILVPAVGGIPYSVLTALHLSNLLGYEVLALFAEKREKSLFKAQEQTTISALGNEIALSKGAELLIRYPDFVLGRGQDQLIKGLGFVALDDVATTGGSILMTGKAGIAAGGILEASEVLCNRGRVTKEQVGNPPYFGSLFNLDITVYPDENSCQLCKDGVPINTDLGKGKAFLERKKPPQK